MLPEAFLSLNNDDNRLWARIAMLAAYVDLFVMQPLMVMMRLCCGGKRNSRARARPRVERGRAARAVVPPPSWLTLRQETVVAAVRERAARVALPVI